MGFIKHALIGIAIYETVKYLMKPVSNSLYSELDLDVGTNPETPLTSYGANSDQQDDPWKNSLANDELRAPDS